MISKIKGPETTGEWTFQGIKPTPLEYDGRLEGKPAPKEAVFVYELSVDGMKQNFQRVMMPGIVSVNREELQNMLAAPMTRRGIPEKLIKDAMADFDTPKKSAEVIKLEQPAAAAPALKRA